MGRSAPAVIAFENDAGDRCGGDAQLDGLRRVDSGKALRIAWRLCPCQVELADRALGAVGVTGEQTKGGGIGMDFEDPAQPKVAQA